MHDEMRALVEDAGEAEHGPTPATGGRPWACSSPEMHRRELVYDVACPACFVAQHALASRCPTLEWHTFDRPGEMDRMTTIREDVNASILKFGFSLPLIP